jgi:hypothetical protein
MPVQTPRDLANFGQCSRPALSKGDREEGLARARDNTLLSKSLAFLHKILTQQSINGQLHL